MVTVKGFEGFENGYTIFGTSFGNGEVQTTIKRSGAYGLRVDISAFGAFTYVITTNITGLVSSSSIGSTIAFSTYVRVATLPAAGTEEIITFMSHVDPNTAYAEYRIRIDSSGYLHLYKETTLIASGTIPIPADSAWHRRGFLLTVTPGEGLTYAVYAADDLDFSGYYADAAIYSAWRGQVHLGKYTNRNNQAVDYYFDDCVIASDALISGDYAIIGLTPDANGSVADWTDGAGTSPSSLAETPADDATSYIQSNVNNQEHYVSFPSTGLGLATIFAVRGSVWASGQTFYQPLLKSGSSVATRTGNTYHTQWYEEVVHSTTDPATSAPWTVSAVDAVEVGIRYTNTGGGTLAKATRVQLGVLYQDLAVQASLRLVVPDATLTLSAVKPEAVTLRTVVPDVTFVASGEASIDLVPVVMRLVTQPLFDISAFLRFVIPPVTFMLGTLNLAPAVLHILPKVIALGLVRRTLPIARGQWWTVSPTAPVVKQEGYIWVDTSDEADPRIMQYTGGLWVDAVSGYEEAVTREVFDGGGSSSSASLVTVVNITGLNIAANRHIIIDAAFANTNGAFNVTDMGIQLNGVDVMAGVALPGTGTGEIGTWRIIIPRRDGSDLGGKSYLWVPPDAASQTMTTLTNVPQNAPITSIALRADPNGTAFEIRNVLVRSLTAQ